ncbi:MAG: hypothetical protein ACI7YS_06535 [Flavobacterium sp.]
MSLTLQSQGKTEEKNTAAANAINPLANITRLQFQPIFTFTDDGARQLSFSAELYNLQIQLDFLLLNRKN